MASVYNLLREACGISQSDAADFVHETRLDTVKSWCSERRPVPRGAIAELQELARGIQRAGEEYAAQLKLISQGDVFVVGLPLDERDARSCGFPSIGAQMRAIGIAIALLPQDSEIRMVERVRGAIPSAVLQTNRKTKMRQIPDPTAHDLPDPAPGGFQSSVNARPPTPGELARKFNQQHIAAQDPRMFFADRGARFGGKIEQTSIGFQSRYDIFVDVAGGTNSTNEMKVCATREEALDWLDRNARSRGFDKYPLDER